MLLAVQLVNGRKEQRETKYNTYRNSENCFLSFGAVTRKFVQFRPPPLYILGD